MKGDFTRNTFKKDNHYTSVRMQQGRVLLDADWNEQVDIQKHRHETQVQDLVGLSGTSNTNAGFQVSVDTDYNRVVISKGQFYVDGILCENESDLFYEDQPDFDGQPLPTETGYYMFFLDAWPRHITAVEDERIRDVAINNVDTTTRTRTVWQVKYFRLVGRISDIYPCGQKFDFWDELVRHRTAHLKASVNIEAGTLGDACAVRPISGYRGIENQLYRIEVHQSGAAGAATFKWSRDNGMVLARITDFRDNDAVVIDQPAIDQVRGFKSGDWIEVTDELHELNGQPGAIARLKSVLNGVELVFDPATATQDITAGAFAQHPKVRRWDHQKAAEIKIRENFWLPIEQGIQIYFAENGQYRTGDYWQIPARIAKGQIEWPLDTSGQPAFQEHSGNEHHYCRLGILSLTAGIWQFQHDCRAIFSPLTEQLNLFQISGDGQEALPGQELAKPLRVGVTNGQLRVEGAKIRFQVKEGNGKIKVKLGNFTSLPIDTQTYYRKDELELYGIAECFFELDNDTPSQQVSATLLDANDQPIHLPVYFNANISRAVAVAATLPPCNDPNLVRPSIHSLFCDATEEPLNRWPDLDNDQAVTVQDVVNGLLFHLDASKLPFKHLGGPGNFPTDMEQIVSAALNYLSVHLIPAGMIIAFANETPPPGWLECNGQELSRDTYAALYAAIRDRFGGDDKLNTFKVPDLRGEFIRGWDHGKNVDAQRKLGDLQLDQIQTHTHSDSGHSHVDSGHEHSINDPGHFHQAPTTAGTAGNFEADPDIRVNYDYNFAAPTSVSTTEITIKSSNANIQSSKANLGGPVAFGAGGRIRQGAETRPRNVALMYCIKT